MDPAHARRAVAGRVALQGNLDPACLYAPPAVIEREVVAMLRGFGTQGYVANLGHGLHPDHDPSHVAAFLRTVRRVSLDCNAFLPRSGSAV